MLLPMSFLCSFLWPSNTPLHISTTFFTQKTFLLFTTVFVLFDLSRFLKFEFECIGWSSSLQFLPFLPSPSYHPRLLFYTLYLGMHLSLCPLFIPSSFFARHILSWMWDNVNYNDDESWCELNTLWVLLSVFFSWQFSRDRSYLGHTLKSSSRHLSVCS